MRSEQVEISVIVRKEIGKTANRRLRIQGRIPAVVYGRGVEPLVVAVDAAAFASAMHPAHWYSSLITLKIEGNGGEENPTVMIAEIQREPVRQKVISLDFKRVSLKENIHTRVPLRHFGESPGVKRGGIVDQIMHEVVVECLPTDMPDHVEVNIGGLDIGDSVRVRDLILPPGVKVVAPEEEVLIVIAAPVRETAVVTPTEAGALVEELAEPEVIGEEE